VRLDSPFVLATAGTLALHLLFVVGGDALIVLFPSPPPPEPAPRVELVDLEPPPVLEPPPPPPEPLVEPEVAPVPDLPPESPPPEPRPQVRPTALPPQTTELPPASDPDPSPAGGAPVVAMPDIAPAAHGVPVARGPRTTGAVGRGGTGTGTGSGTGGGAAADPVQPVSVATIKTRALPKGDFSYFDASKDYPPEARQLGIEGQIRVRLIVDEHGKVGSAVLLNKLGHGLDELALTRARSIEFEPARDTEDRPVRSVVVWTFNMTLPK
jgi:periplasmic protein TonB